MMANPQYKVILLGDPGVGKTTFFLQLRDSSFVDTETRPSASLGVEDMEYKHQIGDTEVTVSPVPYNPVNTDLYPHIYPL